MVVFAWNWVMPCPGSVVIEDGGVKCESLLEMDRAAVPVAVAELRVTWQVTADPATAVFGEQESDTGLSSTSTMEALRDEFCTAALMVASSSKPTTALLTVNCAVLLPAEICATDGTAIWELLDESCALTPPAGAADFSVKVHVVEPPPVTMDGLQLIAVIRGGVIGGGSSVRDCAPAPVALTITAAWTLTAAA
jgi:hypothetical protein